MSEVAVPKFPALFQTQPASGGRRVVRGALSVLITVGLAAGITAAGTAITGRSLDLPVLALAIAALALALAVGFSLWGALAGGWLPDLLLGVRTVGVADGRRAVLGSLARAAVLGALGLLTVGVVPLLVTLATMDRTGRAWADRVTGTATIDVRRGRNVLTHQVSQAELDEAFRPRQAPRPAIIEVSPEGRWPREALDAAGAQPALPGWAPTSSAPVVNTFTEGAGTRVSTPVVPSPAPTAPSTVWLLRFDTGEQHLVHGAAVIGRQPVAQSRFRGADLIRVQDPSRTVSGSHLAVVGNDLGVWVEDLGSTNGSEVRSSSGRSQALPVGVRTAVAGGSRVRLGDRWMTVERAGK